MENKEINGSVSVSKDVNIGGNAFVQGEAHFKGCLKVDGVLEAENIKGLKNNFTDKFLGYFYGVGDALREIKQPETGMFFLNGETNSIWMWDTLTRMWIDTNRVDSGLKGLLTDEEDNSPSDYMPSPQVGIKESYFYVANTEKPVDIVFTYFKNGNSSISVTVDKNALIILFWNGDYWETCTVPFNVELKTYATKLEVDDLKNDLDVLNDKIFSNVYNFSHAFTATYESVKIPRVIPKGSQIILDGDITRINGRTNETDSDYQIINSGDVANRDIKYIKNTEELGDLTITAVINSFEQRVVTLENKSIVDGGKIDSLANAVAKINKELTGGDTVALLELVDYPARYNGSATSSGYFRGYKVDLTPYVGKYKEVYFRGAEFGYPSTGTEIARGVILDNAGNVESKTSYVDELSNGWQALPLTENSKTLWASYCVANDGGEVWTPEYVLFRNEDDKGLLDKINGEVEVVLPKDIYIPQGKISQLFFRGFVKAVSPYKYDIKVMCSKGKTFPRYYEFDGNIPVGDYPITVQVRNDNLNVLGEAKSVVHVVDVNKTPYANVLCVGASATATGCWAAELNRLMPTLTFVGAKRGTDEDVRLEATGGWSWSNFITPQSDAIRFRISSTNGNPAYGNVVSFGGNNYTIVEINLTGGVGNILCSGNVPQSSSGVLSNDSVSLSFSDYEIVKYAPFANGFRAYADTYCGGNIDVIIAHMGVNNMLWENSKTDNPIEKAREFIAGYFRDFPYGKMIITAIPMPDDGTNVYANTDTANNINRYGTLTSFLRYNKALSDLVDELKDRYNISYAPTNIFFDTDYAYHKEHKSVNTRMSGYKEMVGINGVHPIPEGSYMIADGILPVLSRIL